MVDVLKVKLVKYMNSLVCSALGTMSWIRWPYEILSTWLKLYLKVQNTHGTFV